jgi:hypothetical protein
MTRTALLSFYENRRSQFSAELSHVLRSINQVSNLRLFTVLVFVVLLYLGLTTNTVLLYLLPLLIIVFVVMVSEHAKLFDKRDHLQNLVRANECENMALNGDFSCFKTGTEFTDTHHPYSHDLDIFGEGSMYQFLNRCNTIIGKKRLALRLASPLDSVEKIISNQQSIQELTGKTDFRQHFQAAGMEIDEQPEDRDQLLTWAKAPSFVYSKSVYRWLLVVVPIITIGLVIGWFFSANFRPFAMLMVGFQWAFIGFHVKKVNAFHDYISRKKNILQKYALLLHHLEKEKFSSAALISLSQKAKDAGPKVGELASLVNALDARANILATLFVNSFLLYDLQCVYRLEKWKEKNAKHLGAWLDIVSEAEVLCSFGTYAFNHEGFSYALVQKELSISAKALGHPLIAEGECVVNDFSIGNGPTVLIITGANMAGKSTFLRTLGVNLVLALNGAPVCAKEFNCPVIQLRTGMRTADSLKDHQSYFYAELDRLKGIMDELRNDIPLLILLDEILKGTNSTDKQAGSISLVKQLLPHPCLAVIATHDLALGALENEFPRKIKNYCFEANIENDQLSFDYKLKTGLAQKMNATFLMKKMGIIPS